MTKRILLVDDEADIRLIAATSLQRIGGWDVITAANGRTALELALGDPPDAILLDVMMPEMDGPTVVEHLRADPATHEVPILLLTAKTQAADRRRFEALDVRGVLTKPFDPMTLPDEVAAALGWPR